MNNEIFLHIVDHKHLAYKRGFFSGMIFVGGLACMALLSKDGVIGDLKKKNKDLEEQVLNLKTELEWERRSNKNQGFTEVK